MSTSIATLAKRIRASYLSERRAFEKLKGGPEARYKIPKRYAGLAAVETDDGVVLEKAVPSVWAKLAPFFRDKDYDPVPYIAAQFARLGPSGCAPEPLELKNSRAEDTWKSAVKHKGRQVAVAMHIQMETARCQIAYRQRYYLQDGADSQAAVLCDVGLELSALFRYCLAISIGGARFRRIAKRFEAEAYDQYRRYREHYKHYWAEMLPVGFDRRACELSTTPED